ncbi:MAG: hypothetical protein LBF92_01405 [Synergistaceae bacterium]|jgi:hypothetical protein|nr:hypothetical protein [Synergistaceae bacterium]
MSVVLVAVLPPAYSLLSAILVSGFGIGASMLLRNQIDRAGSNALKKKLRDDISLEQGRLDKLESGCPGGAEPLARLRKDLGRLKDSLDRLATDSDGAARAAGDLRDLRLAVRRAELDDAQAKAREESVRGLLGEAASAKVPAYEMELVRLKAGFERSQSLPFDERMTELQRIAERLQEMNKLKDLARGAGISGPKENKLTPRQARKGAATKQADDAETQRVVSEIRDWADRIARMDASEGEKLRPILEKLSADTHFPGRLPQLLRQLKTTWGDTRERLASAELFRETLREIAGMAGIAKTAEGSELARRYEELCLDGRKYIERADFMRLYEDIATFACERERKIADDYFVSRMKSALDEMGYELLPSDAAEKSGGNGDIPMRPGEVRYLDSPYDGYRVMVKADTGGSLSARLVRVAASGEEKDASGPVQAQKDIEAGQKWCRDFDGFLARMRELGLPLETTVRIEPGESPLPVVADKKRPARRKRGKAENIPAELASDARGDETP